MASPCGSCSTPLKDVQGTEVVTIEGLAKDGTLHPVQKAFMEHDALQCGFCTPGMILQAVALLTRIPTPTMPKFSIPWTQPLPLRGAYENHLGHRVGGP